MTKFIDLVKDVNNNPFPAAEPRDEKNHTIAFTGTTAKNSTAFDAASRMVLVTPKQDCFIRFGGTSVEAANTDMFLVANEPRYLKIPKGATHIAAIQLSSGGNLYVTEF